MSKTKLFIPEKLNVGYQNRTDTYTGKLAYVIYFDEKGKLRKEKSWRSWCSEMIGEVENKPTDGFVLNRGVGGARNSWGWNARNEYIRVYDPRGWEFEISVSNLLFILQECTSTKGKGLEGEFVYSWDGTELVLLPTSCLEYKESSQFTNNQSKKVTKDQMKVGTTYLFKDTTTAVYLGRHLADNDQYYPANPENMKMYHIFAKPNYDDTGFGACAYRFETGFTKLAEVLDEYPDYGIELEKFLKSKHCNGVKDIIWGKQKTERYGYRTILYNGKHYRVVPNHTHDYSRIINYRRTWHNYYQHRYTYEELVNGQIPKSVMESAKIKNYDDLRSNKNPIQIEVTSEDLPKLQFETVTHIVLTNGKEIKYER